ncbi:MBL fold metallo-hydrolase [Chlamydiota bacterium]
MKLHAITCNTMRLDGGSMYGHVPKVLWEKWTPADDHNRIQLACRSLFLQTDDGHNILFDVGTGNFFDPKLSSRYGIEGDFELLNGLNNLGVSERDINIIILSHLHFDHAGGLLSAYDQGAQRLLFPNAKYYVSRAHWNRACQPHFRERASFIPSLMNLLEHSKRLVLVDDSTHPDLNFGLTFDFSNGHTIGMMLSHLELPSGRLVYASDLIPGLPWVHLPVTMGYDRFSELLVEEKEQLLKKLIREKGRLLFTHDLQTACAYITQDANGRYVGQPTDLFP